MKKRLLSLLLTSSLLLTVPNIMPTYIYGSTNSREVSNGEYFYTQLTTTEKDMYNSIIDKIEELTKDDKDPSGVKIIIPQDASSWDIGKVVFSVFRDHPEFFWVDSSKLILQEDKPAENGNEYYELGTKFQENHFFILDLQ